MRTIDVKESTHLQSVYMQMHTYPEEKFDVYVNDEVRL